MPLLRVVRGIMRVAVWKFMKLRADFYGLKLIGSSEMHTN